MAAQKKDGMNKLNKAYGFSAEQAAKQASKWDNTQYNQVAAWINKVMGKQELEKDKDAKYLQSKLENGVLLCNFINKIQPNSVKGKAIKQMVGKTIFDNQRISMFITTAKKLGLPDHSSFSGPDLRDGSNVTQVLIGLYSFGRACHNKKIGQGGISAKAKVGNQAWKI
mmetsp:Transcript_45784/g.40999  ORF Transcript_45784/g.40999 Transcript_45784/m.40999 type:complete len:168 (+) Transcript_45784:86-589(+)